MNEMKLREKKNEENEMKLHEQMNGGCNNGNVKLEMNELMVITYVILINIEFILIFCLYSHSYWYLYWYSYWYSYWCTYSYS